MFKFIMMMLTVSMMFVDGGEAGGAGGSEGGEGGQPPAGGAGDPGAGDPGAGDPGLAVVLR